MSENNYHRRSILKFLGLSTAGIAIFQGATITAEKLASDDVTNNKNGHDELRSELDELKRKYVKLDKKSKLIIRALFLITGVNFFI